MQVTRRLAVIALLPPTVTPRRQKPRSSRDGGFDALPGKCYHSSGTVCRKVLRAAGCGLRTAHIIDSPPEAEAGETRARHTQTWPPQDRGQNQELVRAWSSVAVGQGQAATSKQAPPCRSQIHRAALCQSRNGSVQRCLNRRRFARVLSKRYLPGRQAS